MVNCPHCGRAAMSLLRKSALGPGRVVKCQACGKPIAAHWMAVFAAVPAFVGGLVLLRAESRPLGVLAVVAGVLVMAAVQTFLVPLVRR
jgi:hypothetical protein